MTRRNRNHQSSREEIPHRLRFLMQLRSCGIRDTDVLAAVENTPRELFVEASFKDHAYDDAALPIACGQTISQPSLVAEMTQALELKPAMRVLEIGTGSGYQTAILARIARRVYTVERHADLLKQAEARLAALKLTNIVTKCGDGSKGWKEGAPFDRILVTAAADTVPQALTDQLAPEGIMIIPVGGQGADQILLRVFKDKDGAVASSPLMSVRFVPLVSKK